MTYYLFNPENDMALALGQKHYNPPKNIVRFSEDLSLLPLWYAKEDDCVLIRQDVPDNWLQVEREQLQIGVSWLPLDQYWRKSDVADLLSPWGWNYSIYNEWRKKGKSKQWMDCEMIRNLSGRNWVCEVLAIPYIKEMVLPADFVYPQILKSYESVSSFVLQQQDAVLKAPWSSSGKGLYWTDGTLTPSLKHWVMNVLQQQGFVMGEKKCDKVLDFAMEFTCEKHSCSFLGYSFFITENGKYKGNWLESDDTMEQYLETYVDRCRLVEVQHLLQQFFTQHVVGYYQGCLGVDMMIIQQEGVYYLHPCVEINLRMNMGVVAHSIYEKYIYKRSHGRFYVTSYATHDELVAFHTQMIEANPLIFEDGTVKSGYMNLTYIGEQTMSMAYIMVEG